MSPSGVLEQAKAITSPCSVGYHDFFPLAASASAPSFNTGASFLTTASSNCPSFARLTSATDTSAYLASCSSLNCNPRCALAMMSLKLSSKGILTASDCSRCTAKARLDSVHLLHPRHPFVAHAPSFGRLLL